MKTVFMGCVEFSFRALETVLRLPDAELVAVREQLPRLMGDVAALKVPLLVEVGVGPNWEAAH